MLLISLNYFLSIVIITQAIDVATNLAPAPPSPAAAPATTPASASNFKKDAPKSVAAATVISDSGITTQNDNNSTATLNVIDKPDVKSDSVVVVPSNTKNPVKTNIDPAAKEPGKRGKEGHIRKVSNTDTYPASLEQQTVNKTASLSAVSSKVNVNRPTVAPPSPKSPTTTAPKTAVAAAAATTTTTVTSTVPKSIENPEPEKQKPAVPKPQTAAANVAHKITSTPSNTTITTTTEAPRKPQITFSVEDDPQLKTIRDKLSKSAKQSHGSSSADTNGALSEPIVLQSSELLDDEYKTRDYIIPIIGLIFAVPIFLIIANFLSRRIRNYWSKRNYQRMDYLINEMYN